jgi:hypothetical protein
MSNIENQHIELINKSDNIIDNNIEKITKMKISQGSYLKFDLKIYDMIPNIMYETENINKTQITVSLPVFKSKNIIWLALESLSRQVFDHNIYWELIICEEYMESIEIIKSYSDRLKNINCTRIVYVNIDPIKHGVYEDKFLLLEKWIYSANIATISSEIYVLMASDDYMHPTRLQIHYNHFKDENCIVSCHPIGSFYNIKTDKMFIYDGLLNDEFILKTKWAHPSMAYRIGDMKKINVKIIFRSIDSYMYTEIRKLYGDRFNPNKNVFYYAGDDWKYGFFTDGMNNISNRELYYNKGLNNTIRDLDAAKNKESHKFSSQQFYCNPINEFTSKIYNYTHIMDYIPHDIYENLLNLKYIPIMKN